MRFALVDKILSLEVGESVTAVKNLSMAEEYLADHFPGFPVMPGVLMLESAVQASGWLMQYSADFSYSTVLLKSAKAVRFNSFVSPGQMLTVTASVQKREERVWTFKSTGTVAETSAFSARLTLEGFNLSDRNPELAASDASRVEQRRQMLTEIWTPETAS